ncbi:hypothetical protein DYB32_003058 [Aphanomyces invadans]|uniref:Amino acid permease/ SLC12A domain-containing protein n=1 Tax=Aphanomyces invadans TaxID=157072 RepID=A0A3R6YC06_9STRA|nr:hypothetical protein DYB32_003058 [Aphanomyces invadans]
MDPLHVFDCGGHAGGFTLWVNHAFGPFWAFQEGLWFWLSGAIDTALYPALAVTCMEKFIPQLSDISASETWVIKVAIASLFTLPNVLGIQVVGRGMVFLSIAMLLPFVALTVLGFANAADWSNLGQVRYTDTPFNASRGGQSPGHDVAIEWSLLLTTVFWNCNGFANVSTFAGEVASPGKVYPKALLMTLVALELSYVLPLAAGAVYNSPPWWSWTEISFSDLAYSLGGNGLLTFVTASTLASNWGQFTSEMLCVSFQLTGMAESGLAPACFAARWKSPGDVPFASIALSYGLVLVLVGLDIDDVMTTANVISAMYQVLLIFAAIHLRVSMPQVHRPFRVPGSVGVLAGLSVLPVCVASYLVYTSLVEARSAPSSSIKFIMPLILVFGVFYALQLKPQLTKVERSAEFMTDESQRLA